MFVVPVFRTAGETDVDGDQLAEKPEGKVNKLVVQNASCNGVDITSQGLDELVDVRRSLDYGVDDSTSCLAAHAPRYHEDFSEFRKRGPTPQTV